MRERGTRPSRNEVEVAGHQRVLVVARTNADERAVLKHLPAGFDQEFALADDLDTAGQGLHPLSVGPALEQEKDEHRRESARRTEDQFALGVAGDRRNEHHHERAEDQHQPARARGGGDDARGAEDQHGNRQVDRLAARACREQQPDGDRHGNREITGEVIRVGEGGVRAIAVIVRLHKDGAPVEDAEKTLGDRQDGEHRRDQQERAHDPLDIAPILNQRRGDEYESDIHRHDQDRVLRLQGV